MDEMKDSVSDSKTFFSINLKDLTDKSSQKTDLLKFITGSTNKIS